jgi:hypothetical protein
MSSDPSKRPGPARPGRKANLPLLLAVGGVAISMASESIGNETASYAVFTAGVGCTILAILYTIVNRN